MKTFIESLILEGLTDDLANKWSKDKQIVSAAITQFNPLKTRFPDKAKQPQTFSSLEDFKKHIDELTLKQLFRDNAPLTPKDILAPEVTIVSQNPSGYLLKIDTFEQSEYYGSNQWCVSRLGDEPEDTFTNHYIKYNTKFHFLILPKEEPKYQKIAITIERDGYIKIFDNEDHSDTISVTDLKHFFQKYQINGLELKLPPIFHFHEMEFVYKMDGNTMVIDDFDISWLGLKTLDGLPKDLYVTGDFDCSFNNLTSLDGLPEKFKVDGDFSCIHNENLPKDTPKPKGVKGQFEI